MSVRCLQSSESTPRWFHGAVGLLLLGLSALLYVRTADFPMQFDDLVYVRGNPLITQPQTLDRYTDARAFVEKTKSAGLEHDLVTNFMLRPVAYATFHSNYLLDGFKPRWYRIVNVIIHAANAALVYALLMLLLQGTAMARRSVVFIASSTALLFVAHPLATESVTYIAQRFTSLAAFFYLLGLVMQFASLKIESRAGRVLCRGLAVLSVLLGMLTKECTVTAPLVALILDRLVLRTAWREALRRSLPLLLCLPVVPAMVLFAAWAQGDGSISAALQIANAPDIPVSHLHYLLSESTVVFGYLARIFWPSGLNIDPDWPLYQSLFATPVLLAVTGIVLVIGGLGWLHRRRSADAMPAWLLAFTLWFFITLSISSGFVPLPDLMADHRSYLPSVGVFAIIAALIQRYSTRWLRHGLVASFTIALLCCTWQRNEVWRSTIALWEDAAAKSPGKYRVWGNLGTAYGESHRADDAVRCYRRARELEPKYVTAYLNAATILNDQHRYREALDECELLVRAQPEVEQAAEVQHNIGLAQVGLGDVKTGMSRLENVVTQFPDFRPSQVTLGLIYSHLQQPREALRYWQNAARIQPPDPRLDRLMRAAEIAISKSSH